MKHAPHIISIIAGLFAILITIYSFKNPNFVVPAIIFDVASVFTGYIAFEKERTGGIKIRKILVGLIWLAIIIPAAIAVTAVLLHIEGSGNMFADYNLLKSPESIDWGDNISIAESVLRNMTITNKGKAVTSLNMTYNATANLINYTLTWDAEGLPLAYDAVLVANFTLIVYEFNMTQTSFNTDIWIRDQT